MIFYLRDRNGFLQKEKSIKMMEFFKMKSISR